MMEGTSQKIRVVEVIPRLSIGGAEIFFASLVEELAKRSDIDVYCVIFFSNNAPDSRFERFVSIMKDRIYFLDKKKGIDFAAVRRFKKTLLSLSPDVVHTHLNTKIMYRLAFGTKKQPFKHIHTMHNIATGESTRVHDRLIMRSELKHHSSTLVAISPAVADTIKASFGQGDYPIIMNGFTTPPNMPGKTHVYDMVCVARFVEAKNHLGLIEAIAKIAQSKPDVTILLLGEGVLESIVRSKVTELGLNNNVFFGGVAQNVYPFLRQSDCFVLASHYEGSPISLLEALYAECLPIVPRVGGIPDYVKDGESGLLYPVDDMDALAKAFLRTTTPGFNLEAMRKKMKSVALDNTMDKCAEKYVALFRDSK